MEYIIGAAGAAERKGIIDLLIESKLPVGDLPAELNNFFVAIADGNVVGVAGLELYDDYCLLRSVAVDGLYRNRNIAAALISAVEDSASQMGLKGVYLLTETAGGYFEKKGYSVVGRDLVPEKIKASTEFSHVCPVSALVMQKPLPA